MGGRESTAIADQWEKKSKFNSRRSSLVRDREGRMSSYETSGSEDSKTASESSNDSGRAGTHPALIKSSAKDLDKRPSSQPPQKRARRTLPAESFLEWLYIQWLESLLLRPSPSLKQMVVQIMESAEGTFIGTGEYVWNRAIRGLVPRPLDMSVVEWEGLKTKALQRLKRKLDKDCDFFGFGLHSKTVMLEFMETKFSQLTAEYDGGQTECPINIEPNQPEMPKQRCGSNVQQKKLAKRGEGSQGSNNQMQGLQCPEANSPMKVVMSSTMSSWMTAMENRQLGLSEKVSQLLLSTEANRVLLLDMKSMLTSYLGKSK